MCAWSQGSTTAHLPPSQSWDVLRVKHTRALDNILDALGSQIVPSEFHESSADSSIFGSQLSDDESRSKFSTKGRNNVTVGHSTTSGGKDSSLLSKKRSKDRSRWKTLRDFVDDRAIEEALETMDTDRAALDVSLGITDYIANGRTLHRNSLVEQTNIQRH